jgi:hypothetical protein
MSTPPPAAPPPGPYGPYGPYPSAPPPAGSAPAGPLRGRTLRRLGWIFLVIGIAVVVAGAVVLGTTALNKVDSFHRVSIASGGGTVDLTSTGKFVGYYEASNVSSSISRIPDITVAVEDSSAQPVTLERYGNRSDGKVSKFTYDYHGHHGAAAFQFHISQPGTYRVVVQAQESLPPDAQIAIGPDISTSTAIGGLIVVLGILALVAGIVLLIIGFVKRSRHKRELAAPAQPYGYPPAAPPPPPPPTAGGYWAQHPPGSNGP